MTGACILGSLLTTWLDDRYNEWWPENIRWFYTGSADGARTLLSAIAASMIGIAGVVFSVTMVVLTLASGQFGQRLLGNFMRDLGNQVVLGTFTSAFVYCLLILRTVQGESGGRQFVPQMGIMVSLLLGLAGLAVLIYFIHHTATTIQAPVIVATIAADLRTAIDELLPSGSHATQADVQGEVQLPGDLETHCALVRAGEGGYVQRVEMADLMQEAVRCDCIVRMMRRPGQFVQGDEPVLAVYPADRLNEDLADALRQTFTIAEQRTLAQDVEFAIDQLVEIAARALSPGINGQATAVLCVDRLGEGLSQIACKQIPSMYHLDERGRLCVIGYPVSFAALAGAAFNEVRQYARGSLPVQLRLLDAFTRIVAAKCTVESLEVMRRHAAAVYADTQRVELAELDQESVNKHYARFLHEAATQHQRHTSRGAAGERDGEQHAEAGAT